MKVKNKSLKESLLSSGVLQPPARNAWGPSPIVPAFAEVVKSGIETLHESVKQEFPKLEFTLSESSVVPGKLDIYVYHNTIKSQTYPIEEIADFFHDHLPVGISFELHCEGTTYNCNGTKLPYKEPKIMQMSSAPIPHRDGPWKVNK